MMHTVSSHTAENRMTPSAVAACMAPLLLRPLLAGECEMEDEFDASGDGSAQLLAAANAANNAQAIITTLLEEYENVFDVCSSRNLLFVVTLNCTFSGYNTLLLYYQDCILVSILSFCGAHYYGPK